MKPDIEYPILAIDQNNRIEFIRNYQELSQPHPKLFNSGFYNGLSIIDLNGRKWLIKEAEKVRTLFFVKLLYGRINIRLKFSSQVQHLDLKTIQIILIEGINSNKEFWEAGGNVDELIFFIENCQSINLLIASLSKYYFTGKL